VAVIILPLFAFLNAGVPMQTGRLVESLHDPVAMGVALGLLVGKPLGIISFALLAKRSGFGHLPEGVGYRHLIGLGMLAGIGFTMSTFIAALALPEHRLELAKIAILCTSALAGVMGYLMLRLSVRH
jgi:Na+:H+ antiporter, NhaA family